MRVRISTATAWVVCLSVGSWAQSAPPTDAQRAAQVDDNQIVSCLLPARVRKLGGIVYPERRRLAKETAKACTLRGGEFTVFDRATPDSSVAFFKPLAEAGDPDAQTSLGEVYEYLFTQPRYEDAAHWYRQAADQNSPVAQRRLAYLYENGFGVEKDPLLATNLYRLSTGGGDALVLASEVERVRTAAEERIDELTQALQRSSVEAVDARRALDVARAEVEAQRSGLETSRQALAVAQRELQAAKSAPAASPQVDVAALERELATRQRTIEDQQFQIASLEADLDVKQVSLAANLKRADLENQRLESELKRVTASSEAQIAQVRAELEAKTVAVAQWQSERAAAAATIERQRSAMDALNVELAAARGETAQSSSAADSRIARLESEREAQARAIAEGEQQQAALEQRIAASQSEAAQLKAKLATVSSERDVLGAQLASRSQQLVSAEAALAQAQREAAQNQAAIARIEQERATLESSLAAARSSAAGSVESVRTQVTMKDRELAALRREYESVLAQLQEHESEVASLRSERSAVATRVRLAALPDTSGVRIPRGVKVGTYYALVIGNDEYQNLRPMSFAVNGAQEVAQVLRDGYRFKTTELYNVTRGQIFDALASVQGVLKPDDSLVIYFAGRGREVGSGSEITTYWLGVDAPGGAGGAFQGQAISSLELAAWLGELPARHVLVVADSCYSGRWVHTTGGLKYSASDISDQLKFYMLQQSRTMIASGFPNPITDDSGRPGSVFTRRLVELLTENRGVLVDDVMYAHLKDRIVNSDDSPAGVPSPVFGRIENGGHEAGQFVFIRPSVSI